MVEVERVGKGLYELGFHVSSANVTIMQGGLQLCRFVTRQAVAEISSHRAVHTSSSISKRVKPPYFGSVSGEGEPCAIGTSLDAIDSIGRIRLKE